MEKLMEFFDRTRTCVRLIDDLCYNIKDREVEDGG